MSNNQEEKILTPFEKLFKVATTTKESLFRCWRENNESFVDKDKMTSSGLMAEASGLTSLLLFLVAFSQEEEILSDEDCETIKDIHKKSFERICSIIEKNGFAADPMVPIDRTKDIFIKSKDWGYVDSISWVLSVTVLTRFLDKYRVLSLDIDILEKNNKLLAKSLKMLLDSQRDDGTWGFLSNKEAKSSLYFSFVANAALADFFDYILGEISLVTDELRTKTSVFKVEKDEEMIKYLQKELGIEDIVERACETRRKLQDWLIYNCLPLMPEIAQCKKSGTVEEKNRKEEIKEKLGFFDYGAGRYDHYMDLYYIYYLIEMMVTSASDERVKELFGEKGENTNNIKHVKDYYKENTLMSHTDINYYFNEENIPFLWYNIMEQSIHCSRSEYMRASRTGKAFWDSPDGDKSSLTIRWSYPPNTTIAAEISSIEDEEIKITDPCVVPMALRSNTMYCYYISKQPDMTVDRLFENISAQVAHGENDTDRKFIGLWDEIKFSLIVTERSVEAIVDYYDYLVRFDNSARKTSTDAVSEKSSLDIAIEEKISKFISSEAGVAAIRQSFSSPESTSVTEISDEAFKKKFEEYLQTEKGRNTIKNLIGSDVDDLNDRIDMLERQKGVSNDVVVHTLDRIIDIIGSDSAKDNTNHALLVNTLVEISEKVRSIELKRKIEKHLSNRSTKRSPNETYELFSKHLEDLLKYMAENYSKLDQALTPDLVRLVDAIYDKHKLS